jgi:predicted DNA-binding transcriptional regulator YafY
MSTNKHAQIRYNALNECFCNFGRRFYIEDLIEACSAAISDHSGTSLSVKRRQIFSDITFMESERGYRAEITRYKDGKRVYYRYKDPKFSLTNRSLNQLEIDQINQVLITLSRFKGMPHFEWIEDITSRLHHVSAQNSTKILDFEQNQFLKGLEYITPIFNAIFFKRVLAIKYLPFREENPFQHIIHPYYLKQYNLRWFMFGKNDHKGKIINLALDRIISIEELSKVYQPNKEVNFGEYFEDVVGVTVLEKPIEKIRLRIDPSLWPYIETKPIHGSQMRLKEITQSIEVQLELIVNYEFVSQLLSYGDRIQVLQPESLVQHIKIKINRMVQNYQ